MVAPTFGIRLHLAPILGILLSVQVPVRIKKGKGASYMLCGPSMIFRLRRIAETLFFLCFSALRRYSCVGSVLCCCVAGSRLLACRGGVISNLLTHRTHATHVHAPAGVPDFVHLALRVRQGLPRLRQPDGKQNNYLPPINCCGVSFPFGLCQVVEKYRTPMEHHAAQSEDRGESNRRVAPELLHQRTSTTWLACFAVATPPVGTIRTALHCAYQIDREGEPR